MDDSIKKEYSTVYPPLEELNKRNKVNLSLYDIHLNKVGQLISLHDSQIKYYTVAVSLLGESGVIPMSSDYVTPNNVFMIHKDKLDRFPIKYPLIFGCDLNQFLKRIYIKASNEIEANKIFKQYNNSLLKLAFKSIHRIPDVNHKQYPFNVFEENYQSFGYYDQINQLIIHLFNQSEQND